MISPVWLEDADLQQLRLQLDREVMIQVDNSAAEAEVTGRQPDVEAIRQEVEAVGRDLYRGPELEQEQQQQHKQQQPTTLHLHFLDALILSCSHLNLQLSVCVHRRHPHFLVVLSCS